MLKRRKIICSQCGQRKERNRGIQSYCLRCHGAYMRANRKRYSDYSAEQKQKADARAYLNVYVARGAVKKQPCELCGSRRTWAIHLDWSRPLEVMWLCRACRGKFRVEQRRKSNKNKVK